MYKISGEDRAKILDILESAQAEGSASKPVAATTFYQEGDASEDYLTELDYGNLPELRKAFYRLHKDENHTDVLSNRLLALSAKYRMSRTCEADTETNEVKYDLPGYVYVF